MNTDKKVLPCRPELGDIVWRNGVNYRVIDYAEARAFGQRAWSFRPGSTVFGPDSLKVFEDNSGYASGGCFHFLVLESEYFPWKYNRESKIESPPPRRSGIELDAAQIDLLEDLAEKRVCGSITAVHLEDLKKLCATAREVMKRFDDTCKERNLIDVQEAELRAETAKFRDAVSMQGQRILELENKLSNEFAVGAQYQAQVVDAQHKLDCIDRLYRDEVAAHERTRDVLALRESEVLAYRMGVMKPERTTAQRIAQAKRKKAGKK